MSQANSPSSSGSPSSPVLPSLRGRTALVTGSSKGLGKAMALALGAAGAKVALNYQNNVETAQQAFEDFRGHGYEGGLFRGDVISEAGVPDLCAAVAEELGPIDIVVINATPDQPQMPIEEYDYSIKSLIPDLQNGVVLARLVELVTGRKNILLPKLRVPTVSRLQKIHNVGVVLEELRSVRVTDSTGHSSLGSGVNEWIL